MDSRTFSKWLNAKATQLRNRDKKRFRRLNWQIRDKNWYKCEIESAFGKCDDGKDYYSGELLNWDLLGRYGTDYEYNVEIKRKVPSFNHVFEDNNTGTFHLVICSWLVNDMISDQRIEDVIFLCQKIKTHRNIAACQEN